MVESTIIHTHEYDTEMCVSVNVCGLHKQAIQSYNEPIAQPKICTYVYVYIYMYAINNDTSTSVWVAHFPEMLNETKKYVYMQA